MSEWLRSEHETNAIAAIMARIWGDYDYPPLRAYGIRSDDVLRDVRDIADKAIAERRDDAQRGHEPGELGDQAGEVHDAP